MSAAAFNQIAEALREARDYAKADVGQVFPPRDEWDVAAYDGDETDAGYREYRADDPMPGDNHSPAYRWGWTNRRKDMTSKPDGYEHIRSAYIRMSRFAQ